MNEELAKFISDSNRCLKQSLAAVICKEFVSFVLPRPLEEMKAIEVATAHPRMEEWLLSRLFNLFGDRELMDSSLLKLNGYGDFNSALSLAAQVLHDIYNRLEEMSGHPRKVTAYRKKLNQKSFLGGEKFGFVVRSDHKMVTLEMFVEEAGVLPKGDLLIIDAARNVFSVTFVNDLKTVLGENADYYFKKETGKLVF